MKERKNKYRLFDFYVKELDLLIVLWNYLIIALLNYCDLIIKKRRFDLREKFDRSSGRGQVKSEENV